MLHHSDIQRKNCDQTNKQMRQYIDVEAEILGFSNKDVPVYVKKHLGDSKKAKALLSLAQTTRLTNLDCFGHFQKFWNPQNTPSVFVIYILLAHSHVTFFSISYYDSVLTH